MYQIERSKSTAGLKSAEFMEIQKSQSKSEVKPPVSEADSGDTDSVKSGKSIKDKLGAVKDKVTIGINKVKDNFTKISNKKEQKGTSVLEMLEKTKIKDGQLDSNLLVEMIAFLSSQNSPLEN